MKPLLSASQMDSIQKLARSGMQVAVIIKRPVFGSDDLGDDAFDETPAVVTQPASVLRDGTLYGYIRQTSETTATVDIAALLTSSTFELGLPVGTDVKPRDIAVLRGIEYWVQNVTDDESWPAMWNCTVKLRS